MSITATPAAANAGRELPAPPVLPGGRLDGTVRDHRHPLRTLTAARRDLGDVVTTRMPTTGPIVVVMEPEAATRVAMADPEAARAGDARRRILPQASPVSVFGGDDEIHARARRLLTPVFAERAIAERRPEIAGIARLLDRAAREPAMRAAVLADCEGDDAGAAIRETLRLHPPASGVLRRLDAPLEVAGRVVPAGARVLLPLPVLHRDPAVFAHPDRFEPGRFTRGQLVADTYLPFGAGARRCLGEALAWALFAEVLPAVLRHVELRPLARRPERMVVRGTVLVPQRGLLAQVRSVR